MSKDTDLRKRASAVVTTPLVRVASALGVSPNTLTVIGLGISLASAALVGTGHWLAGGLVALSSGLFDMLDGAVARSLGKATTFGALLDSVVDRASEAALLFALLVLYTWRGPNLGAFLAVIALVGSFLTSYIRARAEGLGVECRVGLFTRAERVIVLAAGVTVSNWVGGWGALGALVLTSLLSYVTVVQRMVHVWKESSNRHAP